MDERDKRQTQVLRVVVLEGVVNLAIMSAKAWVGFATGSIAILGDAVHSFTDLINNIVAVFVVRLSSRPADKNHPYGHQKFELLAVFRDRPFGFDHHVHDVETAKMLVQYG